MFAPLPGPLQARPVRTTGPEAAIAGAALATTIAGTAQAVPATTVRREMPLCGLVRSDVFVTLVLPTLGMRRAHWLT